MGGNGELMEGEGAKSVPSFYHISLRRIGKRSYHEFLLLVFETCANVQHIFTNTFLSFYFLCFVFSIVFGRNLKIKIAQQGNGFDKKLCVHPKS